MMLESLRMANSSKLTRIVDQFKGMAEQTRQISIKCFMIIIHSFRLVDGPDQFSFRGIPYASPLLGRNRFKHSQPVVTLEECYSGTFIAHDQGENKTGPNDQQCLRRDPSGSARGVEDCLTLDIFTSNVVYNELSPVVVYVDGDNLVEEKENQIGPDSGTDEQG